MAEDKTKISIIIHNELLDKLRSLGYATVTEAVIRQLEYSFIRSDPTQSDNEIKARCDLLQAKLEEKDHHITIMEKELVDIKQIHTNYMLQMQSLINQRAIEAPGTPRPWWKIW